MADSRGAVVAWSAGVSAAGAAVAVLFADDKAAWQHALFTLFVVIAIVAFVILMGAGLQGLVSWLTADKSRRKTAEHHSASEARRTTSAGPGKWVQENVAHGHGRIFAAQGGDVIVHEAETTQPSPPARPVEDHREAGG